MFQAKYFSEHGKALFLILAMLMVFGLSVNVVCAQDESVSGASVEAASEAKTDKNSKTAEKTQTEEASAPSNEQSALESGEGDGIISISDAMKQGQLKHEKNLVDKFLLGIAVIFLVIAFLLFNSLPPSSPETGS